MSFLLSNWRVLLLRLLFPFSSRRKDRSSSSSSSCSIIIRSQLRPSSSSSSSSSSLVPQLPISPSFLFLVVVPKAGHTLTVCRYEPGNRRRRCLSVYLFLSFHLCLQDCGREEERPPAGFGSFSFLFPSSSSPLCVLFSPSASAEGSLFLCVACETRCGIRRPKCRGKRNSWRELATICRKQRVCWGSGNCF